MILPGVVVVGIVVVVVVVVAVVLAVVLVLVEAVVGVTGVVAGVGSVKTMFIELSPWFLSCHAKCKRKRKKMQLFICI